MISVNVKWFISLDFEVLDGVTEYELFESVLVSYYII